MMRIVINPGTEPIPDAYEPDAVTNMAAFIADLTLTGVTYERTPAEDTGEGVGRTGIGGGRFGFTLKLGERETVVQMPGFPLGRTRFMELPGQEVWEFPRLYVDGSSWLWCIALNVVR